MIKDQVLSLVFFKHTVWKNTLPFQKSGQLEVWSKYARELSVCLKFVY